MSCLPSLHSSTGLLLPSVVLLLFPILDSVAIHPILRWLLTRHRLLEGVKHTPHEDGTEEVLKRQEGVVYTEDGGHEAEVDEEDSDAEVDDGKGRSDDTVVGQQEDDTGCQTALGDTVNETT